MTFFECIGYKEIVKDSRTFYLIHGINVISSDRPKGHIGDMVYTGFVSAEHLQKHNIDPRELIGYSFGRYAIKQADGSYKEGITFKKGE